MLKKIFALILIVNFAVSAAAQTASPQPVSSAQNSKETAQTKKLEIPAELKQKAVILLKSTAREAANLTLPENRVRYLTDAADLLWAHDEKTARELLTSAANDFRFIMQSLDALYLKREAGEQSEGDSFFGEDTSFTRFYTTQKTRQKMLLIIAKHDSQMAFDLLRETARPNFKELGWNDAGFDSQLAVVVTQNDSAQALQIGQQKLSKNSFDGLARLTGNLYRKDPAKGAKLASDTFKKLRTINLTQNPAAFNTAAAIFRQAAIKLEKSEKPDDKPLVLSEGETRELAESVGKTYLEIAKTNRYFTVSSPIDLEQLKKYAPLVVAQIERQQKQAEARLAKNGEPNKPAIDESVPPAVAPDPSVVAAENVRKKRASEQFQQSEAMSKIMAAANSGDSKISLDEAKQTLGKIKNRLQRLTAVSQIARAFAERGDLETAKSLLAEVNGAQTAQPRKAAEMLQNLMVASANANVDPERAFSVLESTIYELNDVIASFARIGEFIGFKEMMDNNEFALSGYAGEFMQRGSAMQDFGAQRLIVDLAKTDFDRTANLADKFSRLEVRFEARMLIVRALLPIEKIDAANEQIDYEYEGIID